MTDYDLIREAPERYAELHRLAKAADGPIPIIEFRTERIKAMVAFEHAARPSVVLELLAALARLEAEPAAALRAERDAAREERDALQKQQDCIEHVDSPISSKSCPACGKHATISQSEWVRIVTADQTARIAAEAREAAAVERAEAAEKERDEARATDWNGLRRRAEHERDFWKGRYDVQHGTIHRLEDELAAAVERARTADDLILDALDGVTKWTGSMTEQKRLAFIEERLTAARAALAATSREPK